MEQVANNNRNKYYIHDTSIAKEYKVKSCARQELNWAPKVLDINHIIVADLSVEMPWIMCNTLIFFVSIYVIHTKEIHPSWFQI